MQSVKRGTFYAPCGQITGRDTGDAPLPSNFTHNEAFMALSVLDSVISPSATHVKKIMLFLRICVKDIQDLSETKIN